MSSNPYDILTYHKAARINIFQLMTTLKFLHLSSIYTDIFRFLYGFPVFVFRSTLDHFLVLFLNKHPIFHALYSRILPEFANYNIMGRTYKIRTHRISPIFKLFVCFFFLYIFFPLKEILLLLDCRRGTIKWQVTFYFQITKKKKNNTAT